MRDRIANLAFTTVCAFVFSACSGGGGNTPPTNTVGTGNTATTQSKTGSTFTRPLSDFLSQQGTFNGRIVSWVSQNGVTGCPPSYNVDARIDYAGVLNSQLITAGGTTVGTTYSGSITEAIQKDGTGQVTVNLYTTRAISQSFCFVPNTQPYLFGYTIADIAAGAPAALGTSHLSIVFILPNAFGPLPDYVQLSFAPSPGEVILSQKFTADAYGALRSAFFVPDGTPGKLHVSEVGTSHTTGEASFDGFTAEKETLTAL
jgi:hypothetical protein